MIILLILSGTLEVLKLIAIASKQFEHRKKGEILHLQSVISTYLSLQVVVGEGCPTALHGREMSVLMRAW